MMEWEIKTNLFFKFKFALCKISLNEKWIINFLNDIEANPKRYTKAKINSSNK